METIYDVIGYIAGGLVAVSLVPQVYKILKYKHAEDLSLTSFTAIWISQVLWLIYAIHKTDIPLIISSSSSIVLTSCTIGLTIYYYYKNAQKNKNSYVLL